MIWHNGPSIAKKIHIALKANHAKPLNNVALEFIFWSAFQDGEARSMEGGPNSLYFWFPDGFEFFTHGDPYAKIPLIEVYLNGTKRTKNNNPCVYKMADFKDVRYFWEKWVPEQRRQQMIRNIRANSLRRKVTV